MGALNVFINRKANEEQEKTNNIRYRRRNSIFENE